MIALASISTPVRGEADRLLNAVVSRLIGDGVRILGAVRDVGQADMVSNCESALRLLPDGPVVRITQDLGAGSAACKMDAGAMEQAVGIASARLDAESADLVVVNKFGLREAEGHGFRALLGSALTKGIPVLIGVPDTHRAAFELFADGLAIPLTPDEKSILNWCETVTGSKNAKASEPIAQGPDTGEPPDDQIS